MATFVYHAETDPDELAEQILKSEGVEFTLRDLRRMSREESAAAPALAETVRHMARLMIKARGVQGDIARQVRDDAAAGRISLGGSLRYNDLAEVNGGLDVLRSVLGAAVYGFKDAEKE